MAVLKCKMCGGDLIVTEGSFVCKCDYCGTEQTITKTSDEQIINSMNRANHFRLQCDFDKAIDAYEKILQNVENDSELYWSLVLSKFGIEYVDDAQTGRKIPTCHRAQYKSVLDDPDYLNAIKYADAVQKSVYESQAREIYDIQKKILEISNKEDPFDVFICYKENDGSGNRTPDSVLAQEIYYGLTEKGYRVFFSRITLENKLGTEYEPYIFAALNSAKVMIVVGTSADHVNATWVKNEWNRFLMLMHDDHKKKIIPAYRDMDPYDLPDALSVYQALDMGKLGFMQDLIHGVTKILDDDKTPVTEPARQSVPVETTGNVSALVMRGNLALEDKEWTKAYEFFDQVLNFDAQCSDAYLGQFLAKKEITNLDSFVEQVLAGTEEDRVSNKSIDIRELDEYKGILQTIKDNGFDDKAREWNKNAQYTTNIKYVFEYPSREAYRREQKENISKDISDDKYLSKAIRFDNVSTIKSSLIRLLDSLDKKIDDAVREDHEVEEKAKAEVAEYMSRLSKEAANLSQAKAESYDRLVSDYNDGKYKDMTYRDQLNLFKDYGDYKDAKEKYNEIMHYFNHAKDKLKLLEDERNTLYKEFAKLNLLTSAFKRKEMETKLKEISSEIDRLADKTYTRFGED